MTFSNNHIELDTTDRWFVPGLGPQIDYEKSTELYWWLNVCYSRHIEEEFSQVEAALADNIDIRHAGIPETTELARKLVSLSSVIINYVDDGYYSLD